MAIRTNLVLFSNQDVAGNGSDVTVSFGGTYVLMVQGTWDGASFKMQAKGPNDTGYIDIPDTTFTADGIIAVDLGSGMVVRGVLTGGTNPEDIFASLTMVG